MKRVFRDQWKTTRYVLGLIVATPLLLISLGLSFASGFFALPTLLLGLWFVGLITRFSASQGGIAYDAETDEISFPSSNASSWGVIVKRITVRVSDIDVIRDGSNTYLHEGEQCWEYKIQISGPFGSHKVVFDTESAKNEVYDFLMNANEMGQPVNIDSKRRRRAAV